MQAARAQVERKALPGGRLAPPTLTPGLVLQRRTGASAAPPANPVPPGHDFGQVRIYADAQATAAARSLNALAYTVGGDLFSGPRTVSRPDDESEREARHVTERVMAAATEPNQPVPPGPGAAEAAFGGESLSHPVRAFFEQRFGQSFRHVRVHTDPHAAAAARSLNARAFTVGSNVVFGAGEFQPASAAGRRLLAHELTHVIQQSGGTPAGATHGPAIWAHTAGPVVQRDLLTYKSDHTEILPSQGQSASVSSTRDRAEAAGVRGALQALITANKVSLRETASDITFSNRSATATEISQALTAAGYAQAQQMTTALMDNHNTSLYTGERLYQVSTLFGTTTVDTSRNLVERQSARPLTAEERTEAALVFGGSLNLDPIIVEEDPVMSVGGYARTLPNHVYFPTGSLNRSDIMSWLIHELTHAWQYQHGVGVGTTLFHAIFSSYSYGGEQGLRDAQAQGKRFTQFNTEQQGDIAHDYYVRLKAGQDVTAWQPFIDQLRAGG